jgi:hypothetical protein
MGQMSRTLKHDKECTWITDAFGQNQVATFFFVGAAVAGLGRAVQDGLRV